MIRQMKGLIYYYMTDTKRNITIFWGILLSTLTASIIIAYFLVNVDDIKMAFAISVALYIFCAIFAFVIAKQKIAFTIKMGAIRKNIFASFFIFFLGFAILNSAAVSTVHGFISYILEKLSIESYVLFHPADLLTNTWFSRFMIDTSILFIILVTFYLFGLIFYKYGLIGGGAAAGIVVLTLLLLLAKGVLIDFFVNVYASLDLMTFYQIMIIGVIIYALTWFLVRKLTIVSIE